MIAQNVTYCVAKDEPLVIFAYSLAHISASGKMIIANFKNNLILIEPNSAQKDIISMFEQAKQQSK